MPRHQRIKQEPAILAHRAHLNLLRGMAIGIEKVLPPTLRYVIVTFDEDKGQPGGYISNGQRKTIAAALHAAAQGFAA